MYLQLVIFFGFAIITEIFSIRPRIVGGQHADIINFPYLVSIRRLSTHAHFCGGAIISNEHILTAAHCMIDKKPYDDIRIYAGSSSSVLTNGPTYTIHEVHIHKKYNQEASNITKYHNDIAIITTKENITLNTRQKKIKLPTMDVEDSAEAIFAGWGFLAVNTGIMSDQLQQASMTILDAKTCRHAIPFISDEEMCAFQKPGVGACTGDSGGPLVSGGIIVGVASYVIPCGKGLPDVYTNVYQYMEFIQPIIKNK